MSVDKFDANERIPTNLRMILIMEVIAKAGIPLSPTEINRELGLPKQTIHRVCNTMIEEGLLVRDGAGNRLRPSRRTREIATGILTASRFHIIRRQILQSVADEVGETVNFVMPEDDGMNYVDRIETDWSFRVQLPVGSHVPFHCTASGKVFLSCLPSAKRKKMVNALNLEQLTSNTITDIDQLLSELKQISKQGFAIDNEEFMDGMVAIAVPVFDPELRYHASLAFHGPIMRLSIEGMTAKFDLLQKASHKLSETLFGE